MNAASFISPIPMTSPKAGFISLSICLGWRLYQYLYDNVQKRTAGSKSICIFKNFLVALTKLVFREDEPIYIAIVACERFTCPTTCGHNLHHTFLSLLLWWMKKQCSTPLFFSYYFFNYERGWAISYTIKNVFVLLTACISHLVFFGWVVVFNLFVKVLVISKNY